MVLLGGNWNHGQKCLQLDNGTRKNHSTLNQERCNHSPLITTTGTFVLSGTHSSETYEYLPKGSTKWLMGETEIPGGFWYGPELLSNSDGSNYVRSSMFDRSKPKIGCSSSITK